MRAAISLADQHRAPVFPATHSLLATGPLLEFVCDTYDVGRPVACSLLRPSWNDTYLIQTTTGRYILRIYGADWHTLPEIEYELELLLHLAGADVSVATPIARTDGHLLTPLRAPEGTRYATLFIHASGRVPKPFPIGDTVQSRRFGEALALLHTGADTFQSSRTRPSRDLAVYLDRPLETIRAFLAHRPNDLADLERLAEEIRERIAELTRSGLSWGVIHGDAFSANARITDDGHVTWYDFDFCGLGWRSGDLSGAFFCAREAKDAGLWHAFLAGYQEHRLVSAPDLAAIPVLLTAGWIWSLGVHISAKGPIHGFEWFDDAGITTRLNWISQSASYMREATASTVEGITRSE
jgi:Ser/Thr protein kinase RdoA (MazF antagonist)